MLTSRNSSKSTPFDWSVSSSWKYCLLSSSEDVSPITSSTSQLLGMTWMYNSEWKWNGYILLCLNNCRIAENFWGRNFCEFCGFVAIRKSFLCKIFVVMSFGMSNPRKFLYENHIFSPICKIFLPQKFSLYGSTILSHSTYTSVFEALNFHWGQSSYGLCGHQIKGSKPECMI